MIQKKHYIAPAALLLFLCASVFGTGYALYLLGHMSAEHYWKRQIDQSVWEQLTPEEKLARYKPHGIYFGSPDTGKIPEPSLLETCKRQLDFSMATSQGLIQQTYGCEEQRDQLEKHFENRVQEEADKLLKRYIEADPKPRKGVLRIEHSIFIKGDDPARNCLDVDKDCNLVALPHACTEGQGFTAKELRAKCAALKDR